MKKCPASLIVREIQIKTTKNTTWHQSKYLKLATQEITDVGEDVKKGEPSYTVGGECKLAQPLWKTDGGLSKSYK